MSRVVYLDNNATTRVDPAVVDVMMPFFTERYGNPSSMHVFGGGVHADVEAAREKIAATIHADPSEIVFTSCGSESDNMAIFGAVGRLGPDTTIIMSRVEHPAVLQPCRELRDRGYKVIEVGVTPSAGAHAVVLVGAAGTGVGAAMALVAVTASSTVAADPATIVERRRDAWMRGFKGSSKVRLRMCAGRAPRA